MTKRMILWGNSPGSKVEVSVRWYRRPFARANHCATLGEETREHRRLERIKRFQRLSAEAEDYTNTQKRHQTI